MVKSTITDAQDRFYGRYIASVRAITGELPLTESDLEAPSVCTVGEADDDGMIRWRPVLRDLPGDLGALDRALGVPLHPDIRAWLSRWCALPVEAAWGDETVVLLGAASDRELEAFVLTAAEHVAERASVPVAVLHDGSRITVDNATGTVLFERRGAQPRKLAVCLADFVDALRPIPL